MVRPLTLVASAYAVGIVASRVLEAPPWLFLGIAAGLLLRAAMSERGRWTMALALFAALGAAHHAIDAQPLSPTDLRRVLGAEPQIATVRGRLVGPPVLKRMLIDDERVDRSLGRIAVHAVQTRGEWRPASGELVATVAADLEGRFHDGQTVELTGVVAPPPGPKAPGLFDYRTFLANQGVHHLLRLDDPREWTLAPDNGVIGPGFSERFIAWAKATLARGLPDDEATALLWAMALGWKAGLNDEVAEPFVLSGTLHIFAISGLHIALIAAILIKLAVLLQVPRRWCFLPVMALLWFYIGATGWQSSAVRSGVMMSVILLGWALNRPPDLLNSLFVAALCILVWEPLQLFQASFQLSFSVVLAIALVSTALETRLRQWFEPDAFLVRDLRTRWQRGRDAALRWFAKAFAVSAASWLGSLPLTAHYFHLVTPGSLLSNLLIVPLSGVALAGNIASLLSGALLPSIAEVFNHAAWLCMNLMVRGSEFFAELPGAAWFVPSPRFWEMALFAVALLVPGFVRFRPGWPGRAGLAAAALLAVCLLVRIGIDHRTTRLTILPLNGGHAVHFDTRGCAEDLLIDAGDQPAAELILRPFLRAQGVNRLPRLALTHGDARHVGGAVLMAKAFGTERVFLGDLRFRSPVYRRVVEELEAAPMALERVSDGEAVAGWRVLHPAADARINLADDGALVLLGESHGFRWLLLSDLGRDGQEALLRRHGDDLRADIVVAGLPTKDEPLNDALLERIQPRLIVVADAELPASERASPELKERLAQQRCPVLFLRTEGSFAAEWTAGGDCVIRCLSGTVVRLPRR